MDPRFLAGRLVGLGVVVLLGGCTSAVTSPPAATPTATAAPSLAVLTARPTVTAAPSPAAATPTPTITPSATPEPTQAASPIGPMTTARPEHSAKRLRDGRVLIATGVDGWVDVPMAPADATPTVRSYHVPVLMYHRIAPASERGRDLVDLVVSPTAFGAQMKALKASGWQTITSAELAARIAARLPVPARTFVITFDDGRVDGYTHAYPILRKYGFTATFFVITGRVGHRKYLTWAMMRTMVAAGMEIGNHTVSHVDMAGYTRARTDAQVIGAQRAIEAHLGLTPVSFSYPFGWHSPRLRNAVKAAGGQSAITVAYTTAQGAAETLRTKLLLPRIRIHPTTTAAMILALVYPCR